MANIIIPKPFGQEKYPFLELCTDKAQAHRVFTSLCDTIEKSFAYDEKHMGSAFRKKVETHSEWRRRADILGDWFATLRNECGYSTSRALDFLPVALREVLNGGKFEPPKAEGSYAPEAIIQGVS
jgi:hypothetical protein